MSARKVDPYEYVMEWIFRHSHAGGVTRLVLLSVGRWMKWTPAGFETGPLTNEEIAAGAKIADSTMREHMKSLGAENGDLEVIKSKRRGETYRYRLRREQVLPLADLRMAGHSRMAAVSPPNYGGEPAPRSGGDSAERQRRNPAATSPIGGGRSSDDTFLPEVRTEVLSTSSSEERRAAEELVEWARAEYPKHRPGAILSLKSDDVAIALELLASRPAERLKKMLVVEWTVTPDEESWLAERRDRGFRLLRHAATRFDDILAEREQRAAPHVPAAGAVWETCPHSPTCLSKTRCRELTGDAEATG